MKCALKFLSMLAVLACMAAPAWAVDPAEGGEEGKLDLPPQVVEFDGVVNKLELDEKQKSKYQEVYKQHTPTLQKHFQQQQSIYTPEQKTKRQEAIQHCEKEGLKGAQREQYIQSAVKFTPEQSKKYTECQTEIAKCNEKFRQETIEILTPQQQEKIPQKFKGKKDKGKEGGKIPPTPDQSSPKQKEGDQPK